MPKQTITEKDLSAFKKHLVKEEKSTVTIEKYVRDARTFIEFAKGKRISKELTIDYKHHLQNCKYKTRSVNSMIASVNAFLSFCGLNDCKAKALRVQKSAYISEDKELTKNDYAQLVKAAKEKSQLNLVIQTICATGIRVSELKYFTVEAVKTGEVCVNCKNKIRTIIIPNSLKKLLLNYARAKNITDGIIFVTKNGKPLDRSYIWAQMKRLSKSAGINPSKVFPHNLRKLFARTFYAIQKDIAKLADVLGHSSIETTRIYIMTAGNEHRRFVEKLGLIVGICT